MKKYQVKVLQHHIDANHPRFCPVELALMEQYPQYRKWTAGSSLVSGWPENENDPLEVFALPEIAQVFIDQVDECKPVKPFEFEMEETDVRAPICQMPPAAWFS